MGLWCGSHEHLHEVDEGKDETEGCHGHKEPLLISAHFAHVPEHSLECVAVIVLLFVQLFFCFLQTSYFLNYVSKITVQYRTVPTYIWLLHLILHLILHVIISQKCMYYTKAIKTIQTTRKNFLNSPVEFVESLILCPEILCFCKYNLVCTGKWYVSVMNKVVKIFYILTD